MTLDEAIRHAEEVAEEQDKLCKRHDDASGYTRSGNENIRTNEAKKCAVCAEEHRMLAWWLRDYKRLKEQEPCGDAVSRQAVHESITRWAGSMSVLIALPTREVRPLLDSIHDLPSVKPQERTGHWIEKMDACECPYCHKAWDYYNNDTEDFDYCPKCGAKLSENPTGSESEDKCKNCEYYRNPDYTRCHKCKAESEG